MFDTYRKIFGLLTRSERRRFYLLLMMILMMGLLDAIGVASVMPFIAVLTDPEVIQSNAYLSLAFNELGFTERNQFLVFMGVAVFVVFISGIAFKMVTLYALVRFSYMRNFSLSTRLMQRYLRQPYAWFLNHHSAELGKTVLSEVDNVVTNSIVPAMLVIAHSAVIGFLVGLVILVEPTVALAAAATIGSGYVIIYALARSYLTRIGNRRFHANTERYQLANESLGGIKDVKVLGLEDDYFKRFAKPAKVFATQEVGNKLVRDLPRHMLEGIAFGGMILLILLLLIRRDGSLGAVLPLVGLYAVVGARLLPAMQQIYGAITAIRFSKPALDSLHAAWIQTSTHQDTVRERVNGATHPLTIQKRIELVDIHFCYPGTKSKALSGVSLTIPARTTVGFVGGSGAGKTTTADIILGLLTPERGHIRVDGVELTTKNIRSWQDRIGYVPQHIFLTDDTIAANIGFGVPQDEIDMTAVERAARIAELHDFIVRELPDGYRTRTGERGIRLSGGQRQRIGVARALYRDPDVLIFDEATSALDNLTEQSVMDAVHNLGHQKTIILIAHRLSTVRECDRIFLMDKGRLHAEGRYEELFEHNPKFRRMVTRSV